MTTSGSVLLSQREGEKEKLQPSGHKQVTFVASMTKTCTTEGWQRQLFFTSNPLSRLQCGTRDMEAVKEQIT